MSGTSELEEQVLALWRRRDEQGAITEITASLTKMIKDPAALDAVEFYLPQFAHMIIQLGSSLPECDALEKFVLTICQLSIHVALQFFWIVYASLQEHRPKVSGSGRIIYSRCARLLLRLEQCVAYGVTASADTSVDQAALMEECAKMAAESMTLGVLSDQAAYSGWLWKKGGGLSKMGRRTWNKRFFEVRQRVLYYYTSEENAKARVAKGSIYLSSATLTHGAASKYENYFEVHCRQSDLRFKLRATGPEQLKQWVQVLQAVMLLPEPPGMSPGSLLTAYAEKSTRFTSARALSIESEPANGSAAGSAAGGGNFTQRHEYFSGQRDFVRKLTDLAEVLRAMSPEARQGALQPALSAMALPPMTFFPLGLSSSKMLKVLRFAPYESIVFHTKARCPIMLFIECEQLGTTVATALRAGAPCEPDLLAAAADGAAAAQTPAAPKAQKEALELSARKREGWAAKVARVGAASELNAATPEWRLTSMFVKSNDDLRQEVFLMQIISFLQHIFSPEHAWFATYHIQATGPDTGLIETITSAQDFDRLKKAEGYSTLRQLFITRYGPPESDGFKAAQAEFSRSLAGYSILMWLMLLRDRHNGNLMLDDDGHYFHVDFGFILGHSTGKQIGGLVECAPFKLTAEYIEVLDGLGSPAYAKFCAQCVANLKAARQHGETICTLVEIVGTNSVFPCFQVVPVHRVMPRLRQRLFLDRDDAAFEAEAMKVVTSAANHPGSKNYDFFQNLQRGIAK